MGSNTKKAIKQHNKRNIVAKCVTGQIREPANIVASCLWPTVLDGTVRTGQIRDSAMRDTNKQTNKIPNKRELGSSGPYAMLCCLAHRACC